MLFVPIREPVRKKIICGVCNNPVERAEISVGWGARTIRVHCHGETEDAELSEEFLRNIPSADLRRGVMTPFVKNLPAPERVENLPSPEQKLIGSK